MIREPAQLTIEEGGTVLLPLGLSTEAGLSSESSVPAYSDGDGRIVLRLAEDAMHSLLKDGTF